MFFTSLARIFKYGAQNFWRDKAVSSATISVLAFTLVTITGVAVLSMAAQGLLSDVESKIDISATFKADTPEDQIIKVKDALSKLDFVGDVEYVSQEQALENFKQRHQNDPVIQQSLKEIGTNPFGATLNIKAKNPSDQTQFENIAHFLRQDVYSSIIDNVNYYDNKTIIERLSAITATARKSGVVLSLILIVIAMLVAFNTIRLTIYNTRDRITIMRLVGSSNWFIRGPLLVENALNGLVAAVITTAIFAIGLSAVSPRLATFFASPGININILDTYMNNFWQFFLMQAGIAIALGVISSLIAMRRYLRV